MEPTYFETLLALERIRIYMESNGERQTWELWDFIGKEIQDAYGARGEPWGLEIVYYERALRADPGTWAIFIEDCADCLESLRDRRITCNCGIYD